MIYIFTELKYNPIARLWTYDEIDQQCSYRQDQLLENDIYMILIPIL